MFFSVGIYKKFFNFSFFFWFDNEIFYKFKNLLDSLQTTNRGKSRNLAVSNEKLKPSDDLSIFRKKMELIQQRLEEKNRDIDRNSQMSKEYEELIKNLEFSIVIFKSTNN